MRETFVVADDALAEGLSGVRIMALSDWADGLTETSPGHLAATELPLGFLLTDTSLADDRLRRLVETLHCPCVQAAEDPSAALLTLLADAAVTRHAEAADLRTALASLRREHAAMQTRFTRFEDFVYDALAPKYVLAHHWHPTEEALRLEPGQSLTQALPVSSVAFAALDISVVEVGPEAPVLTLTIARPSGGPLADPVELELAEDYRGWARFHLPRALKGFPQDVVATITTSAAVSLTTALPSPVARYRSRRDTVEQAGPLALRVFKGLPGAQLPETHPPRTAPPLDPRPRLFTAYDLTPAELLPAAPDMIIEADAADYFACEYWGKENAFLVHPSVHFPVVAVAQNLAATRLVRLAASIQSARQDCDTIAFAIGAAPAGVVSNSEQALEYLGPWQVLRPGEWGMCEAMPAQPISGSYDLFMATSMEGHPSNQNAWALFRDFRITNSGDTA
ncbi:DUF6212 domain-containing protein [Halovulum sp. GXIMD14793]